MNSKDIQDQVEQWALEQNFSAPYGVLTGEHTNSRGRRYLSVTFGRARTLDATVEIYNRNFIILRTSRNRGRGEVYGNVDLLFTALQAL